MVRGLMTLLYREVRGLHEAAYLLGVFALGSQILALLRDRLLAHFFGAGEVLDMYYAAFRIPDLLFVGIASMVSVYVLIPFLAERLGAQHERARRFIDSVFSVFFVAIVIVSALTAVAAPALLAFLFPGLADSARFEELVLLTRIILLQPIFLGLSNLFAGVTQVYQKFALYAVSPILYNVGIIIGIVALFPWLGIPGLGWGVVLGALLHLGVQVPFIVREGLWPRLTAAPAWQDIKRVVLLSLPRTITLSANQIVLLVLVGIASLFTPGSIAIFQLSFNLQSVPLSIIGISYSVAAFPTLARLYAEGMREEFVRHVAIAARHILFWSLPAIALFIVLRAQIVRVILGSGAFDWPDTRLTAAALALFVISLAAQSLVLLLVRGYYAAGKTTKPLVINVVSALTAVFSSYVLVQAFQHSVFWRVFLESLLRVEDIPGTAVLMLPLGFAIGSILNAVVLLWLFERDYAPISKALHPVFWKGLFAALSGGVIAHRTLALLDNFLDINTFFGIFLQGLGAGVAGVVAAILALLLVHSRELDEAWESLHRKFWKTKAVVPEQLE